MNLPFTEKSFNNYIERTFIFNNNYEDYKWHTDEENRMIEIKEIVGNWQFQFDNELPMSLSISTKISIPKDIWHRLIPTESSEKIVIKIYI